MRLSDDVLTVINACPIPGQAMDQYVTTVIHGVSWYSTIKTAVDSSGLKAASVYTIRIPIDADFSGKSFVEPKDWNADSAESGFTLRPGDFLVKGDVSGMENIRPSTIQKAKDKAVTILSVTDNRRAPNAKHWRVTGA